ncbi:MAG: SDR family oxidoreductase [bacterium]
MYIRDKIILITGASSGIGAAAALAFERAGARVALAARRKDKLDELAEKMTGAFVIRVDMHDELQAKQMVRDVIAHFGRLDVLVNNAACIIVSPAETVSSADLLKTIQTNLIGAVAATQEAVSLSKDHGGLHIINIGSPGFMMGIPFYAPYVCSKAAFSAWTRTIQAEWTGSGIIVSEYFPGYILTDSKPESRIGEVSQDFLMSRKQNWLTRKFTKPRTPEDVADQLIRLILKPKPIMYSDPSVRLGAFISNFSGFRLNLACQMARTGREKMKNL